MLAEYYATGKIWKDSHYDEAPIYVQSQREVDLPKAYAMIEEMYGVLKKAFLADVLDLSNAFWYTKAKTLLGLMYFDGRGTEPSIHMAKVCLNCGGEENSISIPEDQVKSFEALRKALAEA